jgi:hypothetical protein
VSAGRRHWRALERERVHHLMAEADTQAARLVRYIDGHEVWMRGRVMFVLPATPAGAPTAVRNGLAARRAAALRGVCDCGAKADSHRPGRVAFVHEDGRPASDEAIHAAWRAWKGA